MHAFSLRRRPRPPERTLILCRGFVVVLLGVAVLIPGAATWGSEPASGYGPCREDSALCRNLAIEVARAELSNYLDQEFSLTQPPTALCPESNPDCCPPENHHECAQLQRQTIAALRQRLHSDISPRYDCPWTKDICEDFGPFYCEPEERWTPLGCQSGSLLAFSVNPLEVPVFSQNWEPCECNEYRDERGVCRPIHTSQCLPFGREGHLCPVIPDCDAADHTKVVHWPDSPLARHLSDRGVQLEASRRLRGELKAKLNSLNKHISEYLNMPDDDGKP